MNRNVSVHLLTFLFFVGNCLTSTLFAQNTDTSQAVSQPTLEHSPHKATLYSLILPGAGQVYNRKYWKVPVVYGIMGGAGYFFYDFNLKVQQQNDYFRSLYAQGKQPSIFEIEQRDNDRVNRDIAGISFVVAYVLQVVDATVDAHFFKFDINQKLSLQIFQDPNSILSLSYTFK